MVVGGGGGTDRLGNAEGNATREFSQQPPFMTASQTGTGTLGKENRYLWGFIYRGDVPPEAPEQTDPASPLRSAWLHRLGLGRVVGPAHLPPMNVKKRLACRVTGYTWRCNPSKMCVVADRPRQPFLKLFFNGSN